MHITYLAHSLGQFSPQLAHFLNCPLDFNSVAHQKFLLDTMQELCSFPWYLNGKTQGLLLSSVTQSLSLEATRICKYCVTTIMPE